MWPFKEGVMLPLFPGGTTTSPQALSGLLELCVPCAECRVSTSLLSAGPGALGAAVAW